MLKRKLNKAKVICLGVFLVAITKKSIPMETSSEPSKNSSHVFLHDTTSVRLHALNASGNCICLPDQEFIYADNAPKIMLNHSAKVFVAGYMEKYSGMLEELKQKKNQYFKIIDQIFSKKGLPVELKYLAVIESQLKTTARSKVGAVGMWQFMPATARNYGLRVTGKTDERKYAYKSTVAAAGYLESLYEMFDDWLLVIAAYNSGPAPVYSAIKKSGSRNFWKLQYFLPKETRMHVKKFIATHYYYEGKGSHVTLTKAETELHMKEISKFLAMQEQPVKDQDEPRTVRSYFHWIAVVNTEESLKFIPKK